MVKENSFALIKALIMEITSKTILMVLESINELMKENSLEIGFAIRCTRPVCSLGLMIEDTKESTMTIKNKVMVCSLG
jgi:hypothetical protein